MEQRRHIRWGTGSRSTLCGRLPLSTLLFANECGRLFLHYIVEAYYYHFLH